MVPGVASATPRAAGLSTEPSERAWEAWMAEFPDGERLDRMESDRG